jgi:hypothetical protein
MRVEEARHSVGLQKGEQGERANGVQACSVIVGLHRRGSSLSFGKKIMSFLPPRSGYEKVGGLVMFGRCLDKIRLHQTGQLPSDYNLGHGLDGRLCRFLKIDYQALCARLSEGGDDEEILEWCFRNGRKPEEEEIFVFNGFMEKRGWRDEASGWVREHKEKLGCLDRDDIQTAFDIHDVDENRK